MSLSEKEKWKLYDELDDTYGHDRVDSEEGSGFPEIIIYVDDQPIYITDTLSVEEWWRDRQGLMHYHFHPPEGLAVRGGGFATSAKTLADAKKRAAKYYRIDVGMIRRDTWDIKED